VSIFFNLPEAGLPPIRSFHLFEKISKVLKEPDTKKDSLSLQKGRMTRAAIQELRGDIRTEAIDIYHHIPIEELKEAYMRYVFNLGIK
jgi:hypothetical protein